MKNKEWLKEQLSYLQDGVGESFNDYSKGLNAAYNTIGLLINQLEEPEQEKVVVPKFVADYIEIAKQDITLMRVFDIAQNYDERDIWEKEYEWVRANHEKFAKAWFGYTVEKEKLYKIKLSEYDYLVQDEYGTVFTMDTNLHEYKTKFTEQEIKNIDERYWTFAEEITE